MKNTFWKLSSNLLAGTAMFQLAFLPIARAESQAAAATPTPTTEEIRAGVTRQLTDDFAKAQKAGWDFASIGGTAASGSSIVETLIEKKGLIFISPVVAGVDARLPIQIEIKDATLNHIKARIAVLDKSLKTVVAVRTVSLGTADQKDPEAAKLRFVRAMNSLGDEVELKRSLVGFNQRANSSSVRSLFSSLSSFMFPNAQADISSLSFKSPAADAVAYVSAGAFLLGCFIVLVGMLASSKTIGGGKSCFWTTQADGYFKLTPFTIISLVLVGGGYGIFMTHSAIKAGFF